MNVLHFHKYQGAGNDFVVIDDRARTFDTSDHAAVRGLCERRFGVGADGLIVLRDHPAHDFEMVYHNADGAPGSLCGNGARCAVAFARALGLIDRSATFAVGAAVHRAEVLPDGRVRVRMPDVDSIRALPEADAHVLDTGSPHYVTPVEQLNDYDVAHAGRAIRQREPFRAAGINVNFLELPPPGSSEAALRTYERGVEAETYACGTGATACALVLAERGVAHSPVTLRTRGGTLTVDFVGEDGRYTDVYLTGPAAAVFEGTVPWPRRK